MEQLAYFIGERIMEIYEKLAYDIVYEMKNIINKNINYINTDGIIIASTDPERVGSYHEGGKRVVQSKKMLIIENDSQYLGTKSGINLPVVLKDEIVGVIGISGKIEEVEKYGQIIKKMTEILIKDSYMQEKEGEEIEFEKIMLEKIFFEDNKAHSNLLISDSIKEIYLQKNGIVGNISFSSFEKYNFKNQKKIFDSIKNIIKRENGYLMFHKNLITFLIFSKNKVDLEKILHNISNILKHKNENFYIGMGEIQKESSDLKISYEQSILALEWAKRSEQTIIFYENLYLEILINNLDDQIKLHYQNRIFKNLSSHERKEYETILFYYEKYNGSIEKTAKALFIHKNTLQYKIIQLKDKIGLDLRNYHDFTLLKLAYLL